MKRSVLLYVGIAGLLSIFASSPSRAIDSEDPASGEIAITVAKAVSGAIGIDYRKARVKALPTLSGPPRALSAAQAVTGDRDASPSGAVPGAVGDGRMSPVRIPDQSIMLKRADALNPEPQAWGEIENRHPFTTSRVDLKNNQVSSDYPFRAAGKLFFKDGAASFVCSGSLIRKGIVVTAAHCVSEFGAGRLYSDFEFWPAYYRGNGPYGKWTADKVYAPTRYLDGTDSCVVAGVVCRDDVALITLAQQSGEYAGAHTGYFGYQYGYKYYSQGFLIRARTTQVSQLGYPVSHDSGELMQRTDSMGYIDGQNSNNTVIGSRQTGGSSGGPWLANLGVPRVVLGLGVTRGIASGWNRLVGVTSWGYTDQRWKQQGASPFLAVNIRALVRRACSETPAACEP